MRLIIILLLIIIINLMNVYFRKENFENINNNVQDCIVEWDNEYGPCSTSCGGGTQELGYKVLQEPQDGYWNGIFQNANQCPQKIKRACNEQPCPTDCVGDWSQWSPCQKDDGTPAKCDGGKRSKSYNITQPAVDGYIDGVLIPGTPCLHNHGDIQEEDCNVKPCAIDCVGSWSEFGDCNKQTGKQEKTYNVNTPAQDGYIYNTDQVEEQDQAVQCVSADNEKQYKNCDVDCEYTWNDWVKLKRNNIYTGEKERTPNISIQNKNNGVSCPTPQKENTDIDCQLSDWSWSECLNKCGPGTRIATRTVIQPKRNNGKNCGSQLDSQYCNGDDCNPTYCCTASRNRGDMTDDEVKELRKWHFNQSDIWIKGYDVWGKIIADNLVSKSKWQSDRVRDFYYHKIHGVRTMGSIYADMVIYPMTYLIGGYKILTNKN